VNDRDEALETLVTLMGQGYAGLDQYDDTRFVVKAPEPFLGEAEKALDVLGSSFLSSAPIGVTPTYVSVPVCATTCRGASGWSCLALGLDSRDAPRLEVPLASRRVTVQRP
jgi:hypothetical protein